MTEHSLPDSSKLSDARLIFTEALAACSIERAFASKIHLAPDAKSLILKDFDPIDLTGVDHLLILAIGKAASPMLEAFLNLCVPPQCTISGVLIAPSAPPTLPPQIQHFAGGHPTPNQDSFLGAKAALAMLEAANHHHHHHKNFFCLFLVTGGASAMMDIPLDPNISLEETAAFHRLLVGCGASIAEINCVRKHFSAVKGGRLALAAAAIPSATLLVSDVPEANLDAISSGPTLPDTTTTQQCLGILERYGLAPHLPPSIRRFFQSTLFVETPKPGDLQQTVYVLLSSDDLAEQARRAAQSRGYTVVLDHRCDDWDYQQAADYLLKRIRDLRHLHPRVCLISAGEVTVRMPASDTSPMPPGVGGRNLHFAIFCATRLEPGERLAVLSAGSDGVDGNSPAAGAVIDSTTVAQCREQADRALSNFASFDLLNRLGATISTGPTGNNLRDLRLLLAD